MLRFRFIHGMLIGLTGGCQANSHDRWLLHIAAVYFYSTTLTATAADWKTKLLRLLKCILMQFSVFNWSHTYFCVDFNTIPMTTSIAETTIAIILGYLILSTDADGQLEQPLKHRRDAASISRSLTTVCRHLVVDRVTVLRHLQGCGSCRRRPDVARATVRLVTGRHVPAAACRSKWCHSALTLSRTVKYNDNQKKSDELI